MNVYNFKHKKSLNSAQEVVDCLNNSSDYLNERKLETNNKYVVSLSRAILLNPIHKDKFISYYSSLDSDSNKDQQKLQCYFNFTSIMDEKTNKSELFSTVFSDLTDLIPINTVTWESANQTIFYENENIPINNKIVSIPNVERHVKIDNNLAKKRVIIQNMLNQTKNKNQEKQNHQIINKDLQIGSNNLVEKSNLLIQNEFQNCKDNCKNCKVSNSMTIDEVMQIGQKRLIEELHAHGHPKSLKIRDKWRNLQEGRSELIHHYKTWHV